MRTPSEWLSFPRVCLSGARGIPEAAELRSGTLRGSHARVTNKAPTAKKKANELRTDQRYAESLSQPGPVQLTNEDPTQTTVNAAFLATFLSDASDEIDAYLEARFALPLSDPPAILTRLCCEVAMYHLNALRPIHDLQDTKDEYRKGDCVP